ncbi:MAG TPA: N,N-dimethylformamidase beta subunit family domain-containing protein [Iamia sp.]
MQTPPLPVVGYFDPLSVAPGDVARLALSTTDAEVDVTLIRLSSPGPDGAPTLRSSLTGRHRAGPQELPFGSYLTVPHAEHLSSSGSLGVSLWVMPTRVRAGRQVLMTKDDAAGRWVLELDDHGCVRWDVAADGISATATMPTRVADRTWYFVAASCDLEARRLELVLHRRADRHTRSTAPAPGPDRTWEERAVPGDHRPGPLLIGASSGRGEGSRAEHAFNGKVAAPRVYRRFLSAEELRAEMDAAPGHEATAGAWDLSQDTSSRRVVDVSDRGTHGRTVQLPVRAVTGPRWDPSVLGIHDAPDRYDAVHLHDDDLDDAGWAPTVEWRVDDDLPSGIYGARAQGTTTGEDVVPVVVRRHPDAPAAPILFVAPVFSWLAYANFRGFQQMEPDPSPAGRYIVENGLSSLYDRHTDGSGVVYSSWRRPIADMRADHVMRRGTHREGTSWGPPHGELPHQLSADLAVLRWLEHQGQHYDVATDIDVHREGAALLEPYRVVVSGTHSEYWSGPMLDALEGYLEAGGRYMYLSGNGLYGVTGLDPDEGHTIEIRRQGAGSGSWHVPPGEGWLSTTGEQGGTWWRRGRTPQRLVGVGFCAEWGSAQATGCGYARTPASHDSRAAFIFEGIGADEVIGDIPNPVLGHGAAGYELDRADRALGTPAHALVVATARSLPLEHWLAMEELLAPRVRADLTFFETTGGGAVFATGSVAWAGALAHDGYDNNVARLTGNVLDRFLDPEPFDPSVITS